MLGVYIEYFPHYRSNELLFLAKNECVELSVDGISRAAEALQLFIKLLYKIAIAAASWRGMGDYRPISSGRSDYEEPYQFC